MKILFILLFFLPLTSIAQNFLWAGTHNKWNSNGSLTVMDTDSEGNVYSVGHSKNFNIRGYISKINKNGNLEWEHELFMHRYYGVYGRAVKTDNEGNCIAGFTFKDTLKLLNYIFYVEANEKVNSIILKFDKSGNLLWHFIIPGGG